MSNLTSFEYYKRSAKKLGIKCFPLPGTHILTMQYKNQTVYLDSRQLSTLSAIGCACCSEKQLTKQILKNANLNTPNWVEFYEGSTVADIKKYSKRLKYPVVVKPYRGSHGDHITIGVSSITKTVPLVKALQPISPIVIVEEMFEGTEIRLLATRKQFLAATIRRPASVLGDGKHTVKQLVDEKNKDPERTEYSDEAALFVIKTGPEEKRVLAQQGYKLTSVPPKNKRVYLRNNSNLCYGGDSLDVTDKIHPSIKKIALKVLQALPDVPYAGVDIMTTDYTKPQTINTYTILEVNSNPGLKMHLEPYKGKRRIVTTNVLKEIFKIK